MSKRLDLTGQTFNRLIVISEYGISKNGHILWLCKCICGNKDDVIVEGSFLKNGNTKSCGCLSKERFYVHGMRNSRLNRIWRGMLSRCRTESASGYKDYGARGIKVCNEWEDKEMGFINFYNWATKNGYDDTLTIERVDVNGNYCPDNCIWIKPQKQARNKRTNHLIICDNIKLTLTEWHNLTGLSKEIIVKRVNEGKKDYDIFAPTLYSSEEYKKHWYEIIKKLKEQQDVHE